VAGDAERAADLRRRLGERFGLADAEVLVTAACNREAEVRIDAGERSV
jgi:hypothetical protein